MKECLLEKAKIIESYLEKETFTIKKRNIGNSKVKVINDLDVELGFNQKNHQILGLRITSNITQNTEENDCEFSKLNFTYTFIFQLYEKNAKYIKDMNKSSEEVRILVDEMTDMVYPYIKEHIESVYNKAKLPITVPLNARVR